MKNYGVKIGRQPNDFIAGTLPYEERNPSGDWTGYLTKGEKQYSSLTDTMACVSFSANHSIEIQMKFITGQEINLSNRYLAKMSNTQPDGNYLSIVANTLKKKGGVREELWADPGNYTWEQYYSEIPQSIQDEGKKLLKDWSIGYEWVNVDDIEEIRKALKQAPLQVVIPGHAVVEILNIDSFFKFFDTYEPFVKQYKQSGITDALKIVLTPINPMSNVKLVKKGSEFGFYIPCTTPQALISYGENFGKPIPRLPNGEVDFAHLNIEGQVV